LISFAVSLMNGRSSNLQPFEREFQRLALNGEGLAGVSASLHNRSRYFQDLFPLDAGLLCDLPFHFRRQVVDVDSHSASFLEGNFFCRFFDEQRARAERASRCGEFVFYPRG
jgi:hypothetical protein